MSNIWLDFYLNQFLTAYLLREAWTRCFEAIHGVHPYYCAPPKSRRVVVSAMKGNIGYRTLLEECRWNIIGGSGCEPYLQFGLDLRQSK